MYKRLKNNPIFKRLTTLSDCVQYRAKIGVFYLYSVVIIAQLLGKALCDSGWANVRRLFISSVLVKKKRKNMVGLGFLNGFMVEIIHIGFVFSIIIRGYHQVKGTVVFLNHF